MSLSLGRACSSAGPDDARSGQRGILRRDVANDFAHALDQQRLREQFLAGQRQRLEEAQAELGGEVQRICEELEIARSRSATCRQETEQRGEEIDRLSDHLRVSAWSGEPAGGWEKAHSQVVDQDQGPVQQADTVFLRRYEKVLDEARGLRNRVQELEQQLGRRERSVEPPRPLSGGVLDSEAEKRRVVARLEAETDEAGRCGRRPAAPSDPGGRRETKRIIADEQAEIEALQQVLQTRPAISAAWPWVRRPWASSWTRTPWFAKSGRTSAA